MSTQSEAELEENLIKQLMGQGYKLVTITDESDLISNFKTQLEAHNKTTLSDNEFIKILNHLKTGNVFEKAKKLRDKFVVPTDDGSKSDKYIEFLNTEQWCQNKFQVTNQITMQGKHNNRYDVTLLINGLPLIQIELKKSGNGIKEAFNQINRYQKHTYHSGYGLFQYIQIFVASNGVNTKYFANNANQSFEQIFYWTDKDNKRLSQLSDFADDFLEPCHVSKMISKYIVLTGTDKVLMILRPYQYYAVEAIADKVINTKKNGYIWHTTGSGKTLTSFKASQVLMKLPDVYKVVFVVDRKDLDYQTVKEFNNFSEDSNGSVDGTDNTRKLVQQFEDDTQLIVTTIQKLNTAISKKRHLNKMKNLKDKKIIFIFDECHRSQFGETHKRITEFFNNYQMFGFTGTPIFKDNAHNKAGRKFTTSYLFGECLHKYVITDAIADRNVLRFSIEYVGKFQKKKGSTKDIDVEAIDTREIMESEQYVESVVDYIIANHSRKTHNKEFNAIFAVSSIEMLTKYYEVFKSLKKSGKHDLKIGTIFSYGVNEDNADANGMVPDGSAPSKHSRDKLNDYIMDYNEMFGTKFSTDDSETFYNYYKDIAKRVKNNNLDILLVVNMFLTGFNAKTLNTLYVDKNLEYHGLIQAFSRTNRILNAKKSHGNIISFRNLKENTDKAITLFSNKDAIETIILKPYQEYVDKFKKALEGLSKIAPDVSSVDDLISMEEQKEFILSFREMIRIKNTMQTFSDFTFNDTGISEQSFEDYKSKYIDLYEEMKGDRGVEKVSVMDEIDFQVELIRRDDIDVGYILKLLAQLKDSPISEHEKRRKGISDFFDREIQLRSKKKLIEKFINEHLMKIPNSDDVPEEFEKFLDAEKKKAIQEFCEKEGLHSDMVENSIGEYLFSSNLPESGEVVKMLIEPPSILKRKSIVDKVIDKIKSLVETFEDGV